jgi:hypothetical protein
MNAMSPQRALTLALVCFASVVALAVSGASAQVADPPTEPDPPGPIEIYPLCDAEPKAGVEPDPRPGPGPDPDCPPGESNPVKAPREPQEAHQHATGPGAPAAAPSAPAPAPDPSAPAPAPDPTGGAEPDDPGPAAGGAIANDPVPGGPADANGVSSRPGDETELSTEDKATNPPPPFKADGTPTISNPSTTIAPFGPAPIGVPNPVIDSFEIPPFLLPIYQACGTQYGIPWEVLASINKIETAFGTNLNVSYAGAMGWMQFMPATWKAYGVDANADGHEDPYNPVDAICAAARYLHAAGGSEDLYDAIFAYNHADWYVDEVLLYARAYGRLPHDLVSSLTGLTEGAHFPVAADARYAGDEEPGIDIFSRRGAPIVAVNDGVIKKMGKSKKLGRFIVLQDAYGNRFTYTQLGRIVAPSQRVIGGDVLARMAGRKRGIAPHIHFSIRPSGRGAPLIDPKPILDGWKLLEATALYRVAGRNPFFDSVGIGAILLMSKEQLIGRVLSDPRLEIYSCGRTDIRTGQVDRRILALLEYLAEKGFELTVTSLKCGHSYLTASGNVSNHSSGNAVDIAAINGIPVLGNQGPGTLTEALVTTVLALQGTMESDELISLMDLGGPSFAMADHADHVHIGYSPEYGDRLGQEFVQLLEPDQWERLIDRLGEIENPEVPVGPSSAR